jgi:hypothetical protein
MNPEKVAQDARAGANRRQGLRASQTQGSSQDLGSAINIDFILMIFNLLVSKSRARHLCTQEKKKRKKKNFFFFLLTAQSSTFFFFFFFFDFNAR